MEEPIQFLAAFPPIQTAIKITGSGDGMRIQLDIPESEMGQAARLLLMREKVLKITVEEEDINVQTRTVKRSTAKRRK
jgi:hypothetical protein